MNDNTTNILFRVSPELKSAFEAAVQAADETVSQALRKYMRSYVKNNPPEPDKPKTPADASETPVKPLQTLHGPQVPPSQEKPLPEGGKAILGPFTGNKTTNIRRKKRNGRPNR